MPYLKSFCKIFFSQEKCYSKERVAAKLLITDFEQALNEKTILH